MTESTDFPSVDPEEGILANAIGFAMFSADGRDVQEPGGLSPAIAVTSAEQQLAVGAARAGLDQLLQWRTEQGLFSDLDRFADEQATWAEHNIPRVEGDTQSSLLWVVEEVGELCHAQLQGEQGTPEEIDAMKRDAVGYILIYLNDYCRVDGLSMAQCLSDTWQEVKRRDWQSNPTNADDVARDFIEEEQTYLDHLREEGVVSFSKPQERETN